MKVNYFLLIFTQKSLKFILLNRLNVYEVKKLCSTAILFHSFLDTMQSKSFIACTVLS